MKFNITTTLEQFCATTFTFFLCYYFICSIYVIGYIMIIIIMCLSVCLSVYLSVRPKWAVVIIKLSLIFMSGDMVGSNNNCCNDYYYKDQFQY